MQTGSKGLELIKCFEGCRLKAYLCPAGVWTIGYGHTDGVKEGEIITQEGAEQYLKEDLARYEARVEKYNVFYLWTQNEFDALVSFAYNIGSIDQLTAKGTRTRAELAEHWSAYNKVKDKVSAGLVRRRKAELELFLEVEAMVEDKPSSWAAEAWQWGIEAGLTDGTNPKGVCTREMVMAMLQRLVKGREG